MTIENAIRALGVMPTALHITKISNLKGILSNKGILPRNKVTSFEDISNHGVQEIRSKKVVPTTNNVVHDYVPFFFSFKAPMIATLQEQNDDLVYIQINLDIFSRIAGCFLTDGNATNDNTIFREFKDVDALKILDLSILYKVKYKDDKEKARKKAAELLIPNFVPQNEFIAFIFFSEKGRDRGLEILKNAGISPATKVFPGWFFSQNV